VLLFIDDLLDSYEDDLDRIARDRSQLNSDILSEDQAEIPTEYILAKGVCTDLVQEAFKMNSYSIMHLTPKENLSRLQNLLYFNIRDGVRSLNCVEVFLF